MDCKKALVEADGDMEKAIVVLREKGLAAAAKKSGRIAAEGIVVSVIDKARQIGVVLEVNSETDFVAKNETFVSFAKEVAQTVIDQNPADVEALAGCTLSGSDNTVAEALTEKVLVIGENLKIRRFVRMNGILVSYIHGDGRIGVMVKLESDIDANNETLLACGKDVALQIAASSPLYLNSAAVPASVIEAEKEILMSQIANDPKMASKPEQVIAKMVDGKVNKYYKENCLLDQIFIKDAEISVQKYIENTAKALGGSIKVADFVRFEKGEGLQKREDNFADEVANMIK
jgi:elongation factor Ts